MWVCFYQTLLLYKRNNKQESMADTKGKVKRASKKFMLFSAAMRRAKRVEKRCCLFQRTRIKTVLQQIRFLLQVAKSCCRKQKVVLLVATNSVHVARFAGPKQTCFAVSDVTPAYDLTRSRVISVKVSFHATYNNLICFKKGLVCGR